MPDPLPQSTLCPVLIGRAAQVAALTRLLDQARAGQGQIVLNALLLDLLRVQLGEEKLSAELGNWLTGRRDRGWGRRQTTPAAANLLTLAVVIGQGWGFERLANDADLSQATLRDLPCLVL